MTAELFIHPWPIVLMLYPHYVGDLFLNREPESLIFSLRASMYPGHFDLYSLFSVVWILWSYLAPPPLVDHPHWLVLGPPSISLPTPIFWELIYSLVSVVRVSHKLESLCHDLIPTLLHHTYRACPVLQLGNFKLPPQSHCTYIGKAENSQENKYILFEIYSVSEKKC